MIFHSDLVRMVRMIRRMSIDEAKRIKSRAKVGETSIVLLGRHGVHRYRRIRVPEMSIWWDGMATVDSEGCWEYVCEVQLNDLTPEEIENNTLLKEHFGGK